MYCPFMVNQTGIKNCTTINCRFWRNEDCVLAAACETYIKSELEFSYMFGKKTEGEENND